MVSLFNETALYKLDFADPLTQIEDLQLDESYLGQLEIWPSENTAPSVISIQAIDYSEGAGLGTLTVSVSGKQASTFSVSGETFQCSLTVRVRSISDVLGNLESIFELTFEVRQDKGNQQPDDEEILELLEKLQSQEVTEEATQTSKFEI